MSDEMIEGFRKERNCEQGGRKKVDEKMMKVRKFK
jgi:hypothetical protein